MQIDLWQISGEGFHLGRQGLGQEESGAHVPSDTLFAALVARLVELRGAAVAEGWVAELRSDSPPFVLSSAFPHAGRVRFFPTPLRPPPADSKPGGPRPKDLKKVQFVAEENFRALLSGESLATVIASGVPLHDGAAVVSQAEAGQLPDRAREEKKIWHIEKRPRVTLGRAAQNSQIYFTGRTVFHEECGLWFGVRWLKRADEPEQTLAALLADLGDAGLGGERSNGFGRCDIRQAGTLDLPDPGDGLWVTLSRYLPRADEVDALRHENAAYMVETVGGWVDSPVSKSERRRAVRMLAEGAVLGPVGRPAPGQIVDVQPDYNGARPLGHEVWRSGLALAAGFPAKGGLTT